jgi:hypothetical protein
MRKTLKDRRRELQRSGLPLPRIMTMTLMLAIMAMIYMRLRDPSTWRWFAHDGEPQTQIAAQDDAAIVKKLAAVVAAKPTVAQPTAAQATTQQATAAKTTAAQPTAAQPNSTQPASKPSAASSADKSAPAQPPVQQAAGEVAASDESAPLPPELLPTGPTDLDPIEQDDIQQSISVVTDGGLKTLPEEMPAYRQILGWVDHQPLQLLRKRAKKDVTYSDFRLSPETMRLQIVELKLHVLQIIHLTNPPKNGISEPMTSPEDQPLYEIRGFTEEGGSNLFFGIVVGLPDGMPIGTDVNVEVRLVGYFFKLQGYRSAQQMMEAERTRKKTVALQAPVIIGRLVWIAAPQTTTAKSPVWLLVTIGSVAMVLVIGWVLWCMRKPRQPFLPAVTLSQDLDPDRPAVDSWLDQAQSGRLTLGPALDARGRSDGAFLDAAPLKDVFGDRFSGNNLWEKGESSNRHGSSNGHGKLGPEVPDNGTE